MENNLKKRLAAGEVSLCMGLRQSRTVDIGPLVGAAGFDSLYVDMEHSPIGFEATSAICIAAVAYGVTPLVRVPAHQAQDIRARSMAAHRASSFPTSTRRNRHAPSWRRPNTRRSATGLSWEPGPPRLIKQCRLPR